MINHNGMDTTDVVGKIQYSDGDVGFKSEVKGVFESYTAQGINLINDLPSVISTPSAKQAFIGTATESMSDSVLFTNPAASKDPFYGSYVNCVEQLLDNTLNSIATESIMTGYAPIVAYNPFFLKKQWIDCVFKDVLMTEIPKTPVINIGFERRYAKDNEGNTAADNSKIKFAKFSVAATDLTKWADGATATGTIKDDENLTVNTISVSLTKVMPTVESTKALMNYSWKDNQLNNGVYTAYLYPAADAWTAANVATGYKDMNQAINGLNTNFVISIANAKLKAENGKNYYKDALNVTATPWKVEVNNAKDDADVRLIDNETKHETTIGYNYGKISSVTPNEDYKIIVQKVQTVFACPLAETAQTYAWTQVPAVISPYGQVLEPAKDVNVLTYGSEETVKPNIFDYLVAHNSFDNTEFGGALSAAKVYGKYVNIEAKLISNGSKLPDYYTASVTNGVITFTKQSTATNPTADVASTLELTMTDAFGHKNVYELPFTVKRAQ